MRLVVIMFVYFLNKPIAATATFASVILTVKCSLEHSISGDYLESIHFKIKEKLKQWTEVSHAQKKSGKQRKNSPNSAEILTIRQVCVFGKV